MVLNIPEQGGPSLRAGRDYLGRLIGVDCPRPEFARQRRLTYTTFCNWRQQRAKAKVSPAFVQVELPAPAAAVDLTIELGAQTQKESVLNGA